MGSDQSWNKTNGGTGFRPSGPALCANGCGFFGSAATRNLCSKCYRDLRVKEEQASSAKANLEKSLKPTSSPPPLVQNDKRASAFSAESLVGPTSSSQSSVTASSSRDGVAATAVSSGGNQSQQRPANRCWSCKKRVGLTGFNCRCGSTFCGDHRYPEKHDCTFDFKGAGRDAIAKANPVVKTDKVQKI